MRARLVQLTALAVLLLVATSAAPNLGALTTAIVVAAVAAVCMAVHVPVAVTQVHRRPATHRTYLQPESSHPSTAGRPQPRAPGIRIQAA